MSVNFYQSHEFGCLKVIGKTAADFLQGQLTCDIKSLAPFRTCLSAYCNRQGRVLALMRIVAISAEEFWLILPFDLIATTQKTLHKFAVFSKVTVSASETPCTISGIIGDDLSQALATTTFNFPTTDNEVIIDNQNLFMLLPAPKRAEIINLKHNDSSIVTPLKDISSGEIAAEAVAIFAKIPWIRAINSEKHLPHSLNLPQLKAVSFKKGCYLGQEIIARLEFRGKSKYKLCHLHSYCNLVPDIGAIIKSDNNEICGEIVSSTMNANSTIEVLAVIATKCADASHFNIEGIKEKFSILN